MSKSDDVSKTVLVIGASRGIGAATAKKFLAQGHRVAGVHRGSGVPEGVYGIEADVTDRSAVQTAVKAAVAELGRLDVLIYNAGVVREDLLIRMREEDLRSVLDTNLVGAFFAVQSALLPMMRQRGGSIVLISSESSRTGIPGAAHYTASKAGLDGLARSAMWECGSRGIRINVIAPGPTETDMLAKLTPENRERLVAASPLGRVAQPWEIADAVYAVSQLTYLTGAMIPVTGGEGLGY